MKSVNFFTILGLILVEIVYSRFSLRFCDPCSDFDQNCDHMITKNILQDMILVEIVSSRFSLRFRDHNRDFGDLLKIAIILVWVRIMISVISVKFVI